MAKGLKIVKKTKSLIVSTLKNIGGEYWEAYVAKRVAVEVCDATVLNRNLLPGKKTSPW